MSYSDEIKRSSIAENWLFTLNNDNSGALRFAFSDVTHSSNYYHGVILNKPSIRESINLSNSTAKSSNISITIPDFNYQGSPISEELFGGSNHYINQSVTVYSLINSQTNQIGSFRLTDISSNGDTISLSMTSHRPWDFISSPQVKPYNVFLPIIYGEFTPLPTYTGSNYVFPTSKSLYPVPLSIGFLVSDIVGGDLNYYLMGSTSETSDAYLYYYDSSADIFIPISSLDSNNYITETLSGDILYYNIGNGTACNRMIKIRPLIGSQTFGESEGNPANAIDDDGSDPSVTNILNSSADNVLSSTADTNRIRIYKYELSRLDGDFTAGANGMSLDIWYSLLITAKPDLDHICYVSLQYKLTDGSEGNSSGWINLETLTSGTGAGTVSLDTRQNGVSQSSNPNPINLTEGKNTFLYIRAIFTNDDASDYFDGSVYVSDIQISYDMNNDGDKPEKELYCAVDGLVNSWDSTAITEIHEAHRDMLIRFTGLATTTPDGWSDLDTSKDWKIRWWQLEPTELKKSLEKLQYEGGFIFRYKADGSPQYIHIKDSHTTDETLTKLDMKDITVRPSSFSELLTKMEVSYEKHPAENRYLSSRTEQSSTSRTNWNIQSKENVKQIKLDALVSNTGGDFDDDPNDGFTAYYGNIFGDIKLIISATIVNPVFYTLEVGKILAFSDMYPVKAFNTSWSGLQFMITSLSRTPGTMKFTAREL